MLIRFPVRDNDSYCSLISEYSPAIKIIRVLCIFTMAYSHLFLYSSEALNSHQSYQVARSILVDVLARSSVPLLSVVSGFLMVGFFQRKPYVIGIRNRFSTIILPFMTWNIIGIVAWGVINDFTGIDFINGIFAISSHSFYTHLTFLRDLFIISLFTPLLIKGLQNFSLLFPLLILLVVSFIDLTPFIFRSQILLYFTFGLCLALYRIKINLHSKYITTPITILFFILLLLAAFKPFFSEALSFLENDLIDNIVRRPICTIFFFYLAIHLIQRKRLANLCYNHLEPAIYLMFLSHSLIGQMIATSYFHIPALHSGPLYLITWISMPFIALCCAVIGTKLLKHFPSFLRLIFSGRT